MSTVKEIYDFINEIAPYDLQENYDNSGINVEMSQCEIRKAFIALDVTNEIIEEISKAQGELVITHHPVIFRGLKTLEENNPAVNLCRKGISAISAHTNFDVAVMNKILCEKLGLEPAGTIDGEIGCICETEEIPAEKLAEKIKSALGEKVVRFNDTGKKLKKIAVCSGSGGSFLPDVIKSGCDGFITGDVMHDVFVDAHNNGICIFDAGHFHTENIFCEYMKEILENNFPQTEFVIAENNKDLLSYI